MTTLRKLLTPLIATLFVTIASVSTAGTFVSVTIAPPPLPIYTQPVAPGAGYLWVPGYWGNGADGYFWVPGTWVLAPFQGALWTPGYWGWGNGFYSWHAGYWGPRVGYYGGINYGFGYTGVGYQGGRWNNGAFYYNRAVNNINVANVTNTYNTVVVRGAGRRISYNGGEGGTVSQPTAEERAAAGERHVAAIDAQELHEHAAANNRALLASVNHGRPSIAATPEPGAFNHTDAVAARNAHKGPQGQGRPERAQSDRVAHHSYHGDGVAHADAHEGHPHEEHAR